MTLKLVSEGTSDNLGIKTGLPFFPSGTVCLGRCYEFEYQISMADFTAAALYVLTNTDLEPDDPRLVFIERVKGLAVVQGWNFPNDPDAKRLAPASHGDIN